MKEDIKNLQEIINICREEINNNDKNITATLDLEDLKSLENLLTRYKQLEEENKEIKKEFAINTEIHKRDEIIKDLKETINCLHETDKENYIPKSKVIEILDKNCVTFFEGDSDFPDDASRIIAKKYIKAEVLQDLLRKE